MSENDEYVRVRKSDLLQLKGLIDALQKEFEQLRQRGRREEQGQ